MAWNAVGVERFRSYKEYKEMSDNLTSVQARCTELFLEARNMRLVEKDALIQRLQAALTLAGGAMTVPPPTIDVASPSIPQLAPLPDFNTEAVNDQPDGIPVPSQRSPRSRQLGPGVAKATP
jgi:hypothetical protein